MRSFISKGIENSYTLQNTSFLIDDGERTFNLRNILREKYRGIILGNSFELDLDDTLLDRFRFKPKLLSMKLYGTTDLWHLLLWLNNMHSVTQFNRKNIIIFDPDGLHLLNKIVELEKNRLLENRRNPEQPLL